MGEYQHSVDDKGRIIVPARFREGLGDRFIATKGLDGCLFLYPMAEWEALEAKLRALPLTNSDARAFVRFFLSGASECEVDRQGRILLPANLREHAGLERDAVVIGVGSRVEVWSKVRWEEYRRRSEQAYEDLAAKLVDLGI